MRTLTIVLAVGLIIVEFVAFLIWYRHENKYKEDE